MPVTTTMHRQHSVSIGVLNLKQVDLLILAKLYPGTRKTQLRTTLSPLQPKYIAIESQSPFRIIHNQADMMYGKNVHQGGPSSLTCV
jgi:hypothetical protein